MLHTTLCSLQQYKYTFQREINQLNKNLKLRFEQKRYAWFPFREQGFKLRSSRRIRSSCLHWGC